MARWKYWITQIIIDDTSNVEVTHFNKKINKFFYTSGEYKAYYRRLKTLAKKKYGDTARANLDHNVKLSFNDFKEFIEKTYNNPHYVLIDPAIVGGRMGLSTNFVAMKFDEYCDNGLMTKDNDSGKYRY